MSLTSTCLLRDTQGLQSPMPPSHILQAMCSTVKPWEPQRTAGCPNNNSSIRWTQLPVVVSQGKAIREHRSRPNSWVPATTVNSRAPRSTSPMARSVCSTIAPRTPLSPAHSTITQTTRILPTLTIVIPRVRPRVSSLLSATWVPARGPCTPLLPTQQASRPYRRRTVHSTGSNSQSTPSCPGHKRLGHIHNPESLSCLEMLFKRTVLKRTEWLPTVPFKIVIIFF